jgi:plastocyanin
MDPACSMMSGENLSEQIVAEHGAVSNVYVYVKAGAKPSRAAQDAAPVVLDQHGCRYEPHVVALQQGDSVEFRNSDPTMHNVHTVPTVSGNPVVDVSQGPGSGSQRRRFDHPDTMLTVGCNNHPWMRAFINVADTPYFAVTKSDGSFQITGLPPGKYTLAAVHEKLGEQDQEVVIPVRGNAKAEFQFKLQ